MFVVLFVWIINKILCGFFKELINFFNEYVGWIFFFFDFLIIKLVFLFEWLNIDILYLCDLIF